MPPQENWSIRVLKRCPSVLAMLVVAIACVVLCGWFLQSEPIKRIGPKMASMKPNTAFCFLLAGTALWLRARGPRESRSARTAQVLAAIVFVIGVLTLFGKRHRLQFWHR